MGKMVTIKASEAHGRRLDPHFHSPTFRMNRSHIESHRYLAMKGLCELSDETWDKAQYFQDHFPYVEIGAINCENGEIGGIEELVTAEAPSRAQMVVRAGDLLVSATRPTRNAIAIVPLDVEKAIASTGFLVVRGVQSTLPLVLECELVSMNEDNCNVVGRILNCAVDEAALTDGKPDAAKMKPVCYDPCAHVYRVMGEVVAKAFSCGKGIC